MPKKKWPGCLSGILLTAAGVAAVLLTREQALQEGASTLKKLPFVGGLILTIIGLLVFFNAWFPRRQSVNTRLLTMTAMFAALCYVGFAFFQIKIPVGDDATSFHLGNVFCVLAALCIGGLWGGLAGAIGMTIGDLFDPIYITSAPKTFLLKLGIGLIAGVVAHRIFHLSSDTKRKVPLPVATVLSCSAGMAFNVVADPIVGYFYKVYVMGTPQNAATILAKLSAMTTAVNAVIAVIAATLFYLALRPALKRTDLMPQI